MHQEKLDPHLVAVSQFRFVFFSVTNSVHELPAVVVRVTHRLHLALAIMFVFAVVVFFHSLVQRLDCLVLFMLDVVRYGGDSGSGSDIDSTLDGGVMILRLEMRFCLVVGQRISSSEMVYRHGGEWIRRRR